MTCSAEVTCVAAEAQSHSEGIYRCRGHIQTSSTPVLEAWGKDQAVACGTVRAMALRQTENSETTCAMPTTDLLLTTRSVLRTYIVLGLGTSP